MSTEEPQKILTIMMPWPWITQNPEKRFLLAIQSVVLAPANVKLLFGFVV